MPPQGSTRSAPRVAKVQYAKAAAPVAAAPVAAAPVVAAPVAAAPATTGNVAVSQIKATRPKYSTEVQTVLILVALVPFTWVLSMMFPLLTLSNLPSVLIAAAAGMAFSDLYSGVLHWSADTWGTLKTPYLGGTLIRGFREHHVDASAITRNGFVAVNGYNIIGIGFLYYFLGARLAASTPAQLEEHLLGNTFLVLMYFFSALSNQFHCWSHLYTGNSALVEALMRWHIILPRAHHRVHHISPHEKFYCITTGWLNETLDGIAFWRCLEVVIEDITGAVPRQDDKYWTTLQARLKAEGKSL